MWVTHTLPLRWLCRDVTHRTDRLCLLKTLECSCESSCQAVLTVVRGLTYISLLSLTPFPPLLIFFSSHFCVTSPHLCRAVWLSLSGADGKVTTAQLFGWRSGGIHVVWMCSLSSHFSITLHPHWVIKKIILYLIKCAVSFDSLWWGGHLDMINASVTKNLTYKCIQCRYFRSWVRKICCICVWKVKH